MDSERARIIGLIERRIALAQRQVETDRKKSAALFTCSHSYELIAANLAGLRLDIESGLTAAELDAMTNDERALRVGYDQ